MPDISSDSSSSKNLALPSGQLQNTQPPHQPQQAQQPSNSQPNSSSSQTPAINCSTSPPSLAERLAILSLSPIELNRSPTEDEFLSKLDDFDEFGFKAIPTGFCDTAIERANAKFWIDNVDLYLDRYQTPERKKAMLASRFLRENAVFWKVDYWKERDLHNYSWQVFKSDFVDHFYGYETKSDIMEFWRLRQSGSVAQYTRRYQQLLYLCDSAVVPQSERQLVNHYVSGLKPHVRKAIMMVTNDTLKRVEEIAMYYDTVTHKKGGEPNKDYPAVIYAPLPQSNSDSVPSISAQEYRDTCMFNRLWHTGSIQAYTEAFERLHWRMGSEKLELWPLLCHYAAGMKRGVRLYLPIQWFLEKPESFSIAKGQAEFAEKLWKLSQPEKVYYV